MQRILITGGTGFVGGYLIRLLSADTLTISVLASNVATSRQIPGIEYFDSDIRRTDDVRSVLCRVNPTHIYHLAAISDVGTSWREPRMTFEANVVGTYNLFEAAMGLPSPPRILNVSTSQVYARADNILTETSLVSPSNPYAASKATAELLHAFYPKSTETGIVTVRSFNHTGPEQSTGFFLPLIAKQFAEIESKLRPPTLRVGNIDVKRDFTDVRDVVRAYRAVLETGRSGEIYNVCSGAATRLSDLIMKLRSISGVDVTIEIDPARLRPDDAPLVVGDPTKIRKETNWIPRISLDQTLADLLDYWRKRVSNGGAVAE